MIPGPKAMKRTGIFQQRSNCSGIAYTPKNNHFQILVHASATFLRYGTFDLEITFDTHDDSMRFYQILSGSHDFFLTVQINTLLKEVFIFMMM